MGQNENQRAFAERIAKIEARLEPEDTISGKFKKRQTRGSAANKRRGTLILLTLLVLGIAALPVLKQNFPEQFAMPSLSALFGGDDEAES